MDMTDIADRSDRQTTAAAIPRLMTPMTLMVLMRMFMWLTSIQELFLVLFFLQFFGTLWIQRLHLLQLLRSKLCQMAYESDQLPRVPLIVAGSAPRGHSGQPNAVLDDE